jgi:hypothetical protein
VAPPSSSVGPASLSKGSSASSSGNISSKDISRAVMDLISATYFQTLEVVTKMVQEGNISAQDAVRHAEALNSIKVSSN